MHKYHCTCLGRRKLCQTSAGCRHFGNSLQTRFPVPPRALRSISPQGQEMRPAPAHFSDVSGVCRCRAPLGFWPSVMPRERLTITSAIAVRKRKHIVFSDRGFGTRRARSLVLDRLCSAASAAVGFPGCDTSLVRAICEPASPPAERKLHLRGGGVQELLETRLPDILNEKLPPRQTWGWTFIVSVAVQGDICRAVLTIAAVRLPSILITTREIKSSHVRSVLPQPHRSSVLFSLRSCRGI